MLVSELNIADEIGGDYVVLHPGSSSHESSIEGIKRVVESLSRVADSGKWKARLLLENTAGQRGDLTSSIESLSAIIKSSPKSLVAGVCFDTCHAFAAGYDISSAIGVRKLENEVHLNLGAENVLLIHVNDSLGVLGGRKDRHQHIGKGNIGIDGFRVFLKSSVFSNVPVILETPKENAEDDLMNLNVLRSLLSG